MRKNNKAELVKYLLETPPNDNVELWSMLCSHYYVLGNVTGMSAKNKANLNKILKIANDNNITIPNERFSQYLEDMKILKSK